MKSIAKYFSGLATRVGQAFDESAKAQNEALLRNFEAGEKARAEFNEKAADKSRSLVSRIGYKIAAFFSTAPGYPVPPMRM